MCLLGTGARASEFLNINLVDINPYTGETLNKIRKGRKPRAVLIGQKTRKAIH
jgi:site-specific recombinase XerD